VNTKDLVVRIVKPSNQPHIPKIKKPIIKRTKPSFSRKANVFLGSGIGFAAGLVILLMLKYIGINYGGLESSLIIGTPALFGVITSFVVF